jgi:hypothetical protein
MNSHKYYSDDEIDDWDYEIRRQYEVIKHFNLYDYLECPETYKIINKDWNQLVEETLEQKLVNIFMKYHDYFKNISSDFLARSTNTNSFDLFMLVKHHLIRNYRLDMFKENPSLATPLVNSIQDIRKMRSIKNKEKLKERFSASNKKFTWRK